MNKLLSLLLASALAIPAVAEAPRAPLPITGTWINLPYKDVRNKYTNPIPMDNTDPELWRTKIREWKKLGLEYLVIMEVANEGKSYYPSNLMPPVYNPALESPVDAIMDEASRQGMKVFMSSGWAKDQDDDLRIPEIRDRQLQIMEEVAMRYGSSPAFYGWYLPVEDCLCPILPQHAVESVNSLAARAKSLTPGKKVMVSPYGIGLSDFDDPQYERQLAQLRGVDIIAYQDEVGCVRDRYTIPRLRQNWRRLRDIHNRLDIELWANCETFTWEAETNSKKSALIPSAYPRLLAQQVAATDGGVDRIISFIIDGMVEDPASPYQLGEPAEANRLYREYNTWLTGSRFWNLMAEGMRGNLRSTVPTTVAQDSLFALVDGQYALEDATDPRWLQFAPGYHEVVIDLQSPREISEILVRSLNSNKDSIETPAKFYLYLADDPQAPYRLAAIANRTPYKNNLHDTWADGVLFDHLPQGATARYLKIAFNAPNACKIDEITVNPQPCN